VPTHDVFNVPPPLTGNAFTTDPSLRLPDLSDTDVKALVALGELAGSEQAGEWGRLANAFPPVLRTHDRYGHRVDEVEFHPAWHSLMTVAVENGMHGTPWRDGNHLARAAKFYVWAQVEAGHGCPVSMTYAVVPALHHAPELAARYEPLLAATSYDFGLRAPLSKTGLLAGMAMTEKQGGSDVRANTTRAVRAGDHYLITGHKWFCSAPMCDLFLVLAQARDDQHGLSCFLVPRVLPDGARNPFLIQRLKDKLGNRSNASSEVEFDGTVGWLVGAEGAGVRTIIDMVTMTRLDCVIGSAAGQRAALRHASHHARHRSAFGRPLIAQPLMREVLADLAVDQAASTALWTRIARGVDAGEARFVRLAVAAAKFWVCKRTPAFVGEALECLGGNGYVEESGMPRLFRESPLNGIWEGSGNVIALDVLRAVHRDPESLAAVLAELDAGADPRLDAAIASLRATLDGADEPGARALASQLARCLAASLLVQHAPGPVAERFLAQRLTEPATSGYGESPGPETDAVLARFAD
jgi:putative acyl-CoA dehydrogenase